MAPLGEELPPARPPLANYLGCKRSGNILYVSGRKSRIEGEDGRHARTATGAAQLPFGAAVQLDMILRLRDSTNPEEPG